jgi:hypothetical protein
MRKTVLISFTLAAFLNAADVDILGDIKNATVEANNTVKKVEQKVKEVVKDTEQTFKEVKKEASKVIDSVQEVNDSKKDLLSLDENTSLDINKTIETKKEVNITKDVNKELSRVLSKTRNSLKKTVYQGKKEVESFKVNIKDELKQKIASIKNESNISQEKIEPPLNKDTVINYKILEAKLEASQSKIRELEAKLALTKCAQKRDEKAIAKLIKEVEKWKVNKKTKEAVKEIKKQTSTNEKSPIEENNSSNIKSGQLFDDRNVPKKGACGKWTIKSIKGSYRKFKTLKHFKVRTKNILGYKYPVLCSKTKMTPYVKGDKVFADMNTANGWVHDVATNAWLQGYKLSPAFLPKR